MKRILTSLYLWGLVLIIGGLASGDQSAGPGLALIGFILIVIGFIRNRKNKRNPKKNSKTTEVKPAENASFFDTDVIYSGIPQEYCGGKLAYSYDDVKFNCISERLAQGIPDNMRLTMNLDQNNRKDEQSAALFYKNVLIGYLYNNKLKTMVMDFAADPNRGVLILGREWEGEPMVKLCFYKPDMNQLLDDDDEDEEDDDE